MKPSRIATRRLANLPWSPSMLSTSSATNKRSSAVLTVELSTRTMCTVPARLGDKESLDNQVQGSNKTVGMAIVLLGVVLVVYDVSQQETKCQPRRIVLITRQKKMSMNYTRTRNVSTIEMHCCH